MHKAYSKGLGTLAFPVDFFAVFAAEIDNGVDPQEFQFRKTRLFGLCAAIEKVSDFAGVVHTGDLQFLPKSGLHEGRCIGGRGGLREKAKWKNKEKSKSWESALHIQ